jgi:hypothetical protein
VVLDAHCSGGDAADLERRGQCYNQDECGRAIVGRH